MEGLVASIDAIKGDALAAIGKKKIDRAGWLLRRGLNFFQRRGRAGGTGCRPTK